MNRLSFPAFVVSSALVATACGADAGSTADAGSDAATADVAADSAVDSGDSGGDSTADVAADVPVDVSPTAACYADCAKQKADCATLDLAGCHGLCDYVIPGMTPACAKLHAAVWKCEAVELWTCATDTTIVGKPVNPGMCPTQNAALKGQNCK